MDVRALAEARILDADGASFRVGDLWRERPAVIVWLRHFGCVYCREQVKELSAVEPALEAAGIRLVFIGNGTPRAARWFRDKHAAGETVLTDPELVTYRIIGTRRGVTSTLGPHTWKHAIRALRRGARQGRVRGHPFEQGAVLVIDRRGTVHYRHVSRSAGDHPEAGDVVDAASAALGGVPGIAASA